MKFKPLSLFSARKILWAFLALAIPAQADSPTFPKIRALGLPDVRTLATNRAPAIALASAKVKAAEAEQREISRRVKIDTTGGLDPFSGQVRFYLALDLERLAGLNKGEKNKAAQVVEAERISATEAQNSAIKSVTVSWFALRGAIATEKSAARNLTTARALYKASDARFKAGTGELGAVLSAMSGKANAEDNLRAARSAIILACLDLAQSCGYSTAEEMEAALLAAPSARPAKEPKPTPRKSPRADASPEIAPSAEMPQLAALDEIELPEIEPEELAEIEPQPDTMPQE